METALLGGAAILAIIFMNSQKHTSKADPKAYPQCFEICKATRDIFDLLQKHQLLNTPEADILMKLFSNILCMEMDNNCDLLQDRIFYILNNFGEPQLRPQLLTNLLKSKIGEFDENNKALALILTTTDHIERNLQQLLSADIPNSSKQQLQELTTTFYQVHYPIILQICSAL